MFKQLFSRSSKDEETTGSYTYQQVAKHNTKDDLWIVLHGKVYDMTTYLSQHPGGSILLERAGRDVSRDYWQVSMHNMARKKIEEILEQHYVGKLKPS